MKTAVVTGATGFIGYALTELLSKQGVKVYAIGRKEKDLHELALLQNVQAIYADFGEGMSLERDIQEAVDVFFHCAFSGGFSQSALSDYALQLENAKYACDAVCSAIKLCAQKFVLVSSVNTEELRLFQNAADVEETPRYTCIYAAAKQAAEIMGKTLARNEHMQFCVASIAMAFGERNRSRMLPNVVMRQLLSGETSQLISGEQLYDLIYVDDVAGGLVAIGELGRDFQNYYLGHRKLRLFKDWMTDIRDALSPGAQLEFGVWPNPPTIDYSKIDLNLLFRDTGFECSCDFKASIVKTAAWLKTQKELML